MVARTISGNKDLTLWKLCENNWMQLRTIKFWCMRDGRCSEGSLILVKLAVAEEHGLYMGFPWSQASVIYQPWAIILQSRSSDSIDSFARNIHRCSIHIYGKDDVVNSYVSMECVTCCKYQYGVKSSFVKMFRDNILKGIYDSLMEGNEWVDEEVSGKVSTVGWDRMSCVGGRKERI